MEGRIVKGRWRVDQKLGEGGSGVVYSATDGQGGKAAIKVLHKELAREKDLRTRFLREGYAANTIQHPGVVRVLDADFMDDGMPFVAMELLDGESLEQRALRQPDKKLPIPDVLHALDQLLDVLAAAHAVGIIHRDVKPDNVVVLRDGRVKVLDFGLARMKVEIEALRIEGTGTGVVLGTLDFMSPEQARAENATIDARADLWSVGATAFTTISGRRVHAGKTLSEYMVATAYEPAKSLAAVAPETPPAIVHVVDRALALDKNQRWESARAMQHALRAAYAASFGT